MRTGKARAWSQANVVGGLVLSVLLGACVNLEQRSAPMATRAMGATAGYRIAQLGHGEASYFGLCLAPICPEVTRKSFPTPPVSGVPPGIGAALPMPLPARPSVLAVHFSTGSSVLATPDKQRITQWSAEVPDAGTISIAGRTDNVGGEALNHRLASARARAIAAYLREQLGVAPARVSWEGHGLCCYVGDNATHAGRSANRRAEVTFHPLPEAQP